MDLCKFKAILVYIESSWTARDMQKEILSRQIDIQIDRQKEERYSPQSNKEDKYSPGILRNKMGCHVVMLRTGRDEKGPQRDQGIPGAPESLELGVEA